MRQFLEKGNRVSQNSDKGKYWPYMILGFLAIGITLGYWTIKNTISLPVRESNEYMMKYQKAEQDINSITKEEALFDSKYNLNFSGLEKSDFKPKNLKRKPHQYWTLKQSNKIIYTVKEKDGTAINDANVTLLLTRPSTNVDDKMFKNIKSDGNGNYIIENLTINKPGRYILRVRIQKGKAAKFADTYCFAPKNK